MVPFSPDTAAKLDGFEPASKNTETATPPIFNLPTELHLAISDLLPYPDALALKNTNRHFYSIVRVSVKLKVDWLLERRRLHLDCPNEIRCALGSDIRFCRGSVSLLMQRRREHIECESRPGLGCVVLGTRTCPQRLQARSSWLTSLIAGSSIKMCLLLLALAMLAAGGLWKLHTSSFF